MGKVGTPTNTMVLLFTRIEYIIFHVVKNK